MLASKYQPSTKTELTKNITKSLRKLIHDRERSLDIRIHGSSRIGGISLLVPVFRTVPSCVVSFDTHIWQACFLAEDYNDVVDAFLHEGRWITACGGIVVVDSFTIENGWCVSWPVVDCELWGAVVTVEATAPWFARNVSVKKRN